LLRRLSVADGGERGSQHDALDACIASGAQNAEGAFASGHDQFVLVFGPAGVAFEIGGEEGQAARSCNIE